MVLVSGGEYREQVVVSSPGVSIIGQGAMPDGLGAGPVRLTWSVENVAVLNVTAPDFVLSNVTVSVHPSSPAFASASAFAI